MDLTIFRLADEARRMGGDLGAHESFQHFAGLTQDQFNFLVEVVEDTEDYDWR